MRRLDSVQEAPGLSARGAWTRCQRLLDSVQEAPGLGSRGAWTQCKKGMDSVQRGAWTEKPTARKSEGITTTSLFTMKVVQKDRRWKDISVGLGGNSFSVIE